MGEPNSSPHMASSIGSSSHQAASGELEIPQPVTNNPNREDIIMQRIAGLDATMQRVCGVLSSISSQPGLSQGDQSAPSLPVSSVLQSNPSSLAGGPISSPTVGQVHPATAPAFVPLAQNQYAQGTPLPAQSVLNTVLPQFRLGQNCMGSGALPTVPIPSLPVSPTLPPVPGYLVEKIAKGQFVDFGLLRPGNLKKLPVDEPTQVQMAKLFRGELLPIRNFSDWTEAWAVHSAVVAAKLPSKVQDHFAYFLLLSSANREVPGTGWLDYDIAFRKLAAEKPSTIWGEVMPTLWMTTVLAKKPNPLPRDNLSNQLPCFKWNDSICSLARCKYSHVCATCRGAHKRIACPITAADGIAQPTSRPESPAPKKSARR